MQNEVTPEALRPHRVPSDSITSPPTPPPTFNPPADTPADPAYSITPPISNDSSPMTSASIANTSPESPYSPAASSIPRRPDLRAVQRVSDDVILSSPGTGSQGSVTSSPNGSEGGEHLQEMRTRLLSESSSASSSRRESDSRGSSRWDSESSTPTSSMDINVTAPTPPLASEDQEKQSEAGPGRLNTSPPSSTFSPKLPNIDTSIEHKWDSVWPATVQPRPLAAEHILPPFSSAPVSPFVTPTFSASAPLVSRRAMSPTLAPSSPTLKRSSSPIRYSPRSATSSSDIPTRISPPHSHPSPSRHSRTQSSGSTTIMRPSSDQTRPLSPPLNAYNNGDMLASTSKQRINDSLSRRVDTQSPQLRARTGSSGNGYRPRRTSFSDAQPLRFSPDTRARRSPIPQPVTEDEIPPLPTNGSSFALPPPVAAPPFELTAGDDGTISPTQLFSPPLVAPLSRPAALRRALSDYDPSQRPPSNQFHRTLSATANLEVSPVHRPAPTEADILPVENGEPDPTPEMAPSSQNNESLAPAESPELPADNEPVFQNDEVGDLNLVDEGDVLPTGEYPMDVTFDDEGLNTLERIFLLSQSDFGFHRAYVARVLGDLLEDVDPCESVEYVLPLLNGYSVDEDETVKEAFSSELHRILWYFFSTCHLLSEPRETVTVSSEGMETVPRPALESPLDLPTMDMSRRPSISSVAGPSSADSSLTNPMSSVFEQSEAATPSSVTSISSDQTAFSPLPWVDVNVGGDEEKEPAHLVAQPELVISTFTPLLGNLMLSPNPVVGDHTRDAIIAVIARLRGTTDEEKWVRAVGDQDKRKTFISQDGLHAHDLRPFSAEAKVQVEAELLNGIVLGMGRLSTELPETFYGSSAGSQDGLVDDQEGRLLEEAEAYRLQLLQEAEAGRAISLYLIGSLCDVYPGEEVVSRGFLDEVLNAPDGDETTRTEGAVALSRMAKIVPSQHIHELLNVFSAFVNDPESESVQQAIAVALPVLAKRIDDPDEKRRFAVAGIEALFDSGDKCRCAGLEILGQLIYLFADDPEGPPQELLDKYWDDSDTRRVFPGDCVWDIIAAYNFPGVCLTLGPKRWRELRELFQRLQDRGGPKVLSTIASSIHELAKILEPKQVAEDLLPVYTRLIDAKDDIRERVFEHVDDFIAGLPDELAWMTFLGLGEAWKCDTLGGWRAREAVALHLPAFLKLFTARDVDVTPILNMTSVALLDKFAAVRDAAIRSVPASYQILQTTRFEAPYRDMIIDLSNASAFRQRVTFTRCLKEFIKPPPHREPFERFFAQALPRLRTDVVDVRIALAQLVSALFVVGGYYETVSNIPPVISQLAQALAEDDAVDVRNAVRHVDLDRLKKGKAPAVDHSEAPNLSGRGTAEAYQRATDGRTQSSEVKGNAAGREPISNTRDHDHNHDHDPDSTPRVGQHPDPTRVVDPFATSFQDAIRDATAE